MSDNRSSSFCRWRWSNPRRTPFWARRYRRDYFSLVMRGAQRSLLVMFIIGAIAATLGTIIGAVAGFFRGWVDAILMRLVDFIITVPVIIIGSVIGFHYGNKGAAFLALLLGLFAWTGLSRLVRGEFLTLREREFVDAARVAGATNRRIIFKHILPNAVGVIIVSVTLLHVRRNTSRDRSQFLRFRRYRSRCFTWPSHLDLSRCIHHPALAILVSRSIHYHNCPLH